MEKAFKQLRLSIKLRFIIATCLTILFLVLGTTLGIIYKQTILLIFIFFCGLAIFPLVFLVGKNKFEEKKIALIEQALLSIDETIQYKYQEQTTIDDFLTLDITNLTDYFFLSHFIKKEYDRASFISYGVRFRTNDKKSVVGRFIKINFDECNLKKEDITGAFLKNATYLKKVLIKNNSVYIFVTSYQKDKVSRMFSLEPHDFKSLNLYLERIKMEIDFIEKIISKN